MSRRIELSREKPTRTPLVGARLAALGCFIRLLIMAGLLLASVQSARADEAALPFNIPGQPMANALNSWAVQANAQVFFEQGLVSGLSAPAVSGSMAPTQALRALLAQSNLEFVQHSDGAFVVRRRAARVVHRKPPPPAPVPAAPTEAPVAAPVVLEKRTARDSEGAWLVRVRGFYFEPRHGDFRASGGWSPEFDLEYYLDSNWSAELSSGLPIVHELSLRDSPLANGTVGNFRLLPTFLMLKYGMNPEGLLRPYVGIGANVTSYYGVNAVPFGLTKTTAGPALQVGLDLHLADHWVLNADIKWARMRPTVETTAQRLGPMPIDPVLFGIGIGYRFGGSPAPAPAASPPPSTEGAGIAAPDTGS